MTVDPRVPAGLRHVAATQETPYGTVASSWTVKGGRLDLAVTVPVGSTATVVVPRTAPGASPGAAAGRGAVAVKATAGARPLRHDAGSAVYAVGSGHWHFTAG